MALTNSNTHKFQSGELVTADKLNNTQIIQGDNTSANDAFTGSPGQITYDNQTKKVRLHDGITAGGFVLQRTSDASNISSGDIGTTELANGAVTTDKIADDAVTADKLAETYSLSTHTHADATTTDSGFLSATDKSKIDNDFLVASDLSTVSEASKPNVGGVATGSGGFDNTVISASNASGNNITYSVTTKGAPANAKFAIVTFELVGNVVPSCNVYVFNTTNFANGHKVYSNFSDKAQGLCAQFLCPIQSNGNIYLRVDNAGGGTGYTMKYMGYI